MCEALLDGECKDIDCRALDLDRLRQSRCQNLIQVPLNDRGADTSHARCLVSDELAITQERTHPDSANPSVFPTSSSMLTAVFEAVLPAATGIVRSRRIREH